MPSAHSWAGRPHKSSAVTAGKTILGGRLCADGKGPRTFYTMELTDRYLPSWIDITFSMLGKIKENDKK
jgi:hypothetical protein